MRRLFRRLAFLSIRIGAVGLAAFLLLEFLLLAFNDAFFPQAFFRFDPDMGFRVRPNAVYGAGERANEFGFNDRDYPHERSAGTYRILVLGDSFNWMGGQRYNYTELLERAFALRLGEGRVEVINAGYSMTHTAEQLEALKKFGLQYNPDLVVLGFFAGNDFFDADPRRIRVVVGDAYTDVYRGRDPYFTLLGQPVVLQSRLFLNLRQIWIVRRQMRHQRQSAPQPSAPPPPPRSPLAENPADVGELLRPDPDWTPASQPGAVSMPPDSYLQLVRTRLSFTEPARSHLFQEREQYILSSLLEMRGLLQQRGIELLVAAYPAEFQVDDRLLQSVREEFGGEFDLDRAQRILEEFCRREGIEFRDFLPDFRRKHREGYRLYLERDTHWNHNGNKLAALLFFRMLIERVEGGS